MTANQQILLFNIVLVASGLFGYAAKWRGWIRSERAATFMKIAIIGFEAPLGLLAVWSLPLQPGTWKIPLAGVSVALVMLAVGFALATALRLRRPQRPAFAASASVSNVGYTLGGYLALAMLGPGGLGYQYVYVVFWPFFIFLIWFPIGHHYASTEPLHPLRLVWRSLTDLRSLPLYAVTAGLLLNWRGVPYPSGVFDAVYAKPLLLIGGMAASYIGIGLTVTIRAMRPHLAQSILMSVLKFVVTPLVMLGVVTLLGLDGLGRQLCLLLALMPCGIYSVMVATLFRLDRDLTVTNFLVSHGLFFAVILWLVVPWVITW